MARKVLFVSEEHGASRAAYALKLLIREGRLAIASAGKDPGTGRLRTRSYGVEGPVSLLMTTTAAEVDPELANRLVVLGVDEDRAQTRAVQAAQRRGATLEGLVARLGRESVIRLHRNAQRLLEALPVVVPGAEELAFPDSSTRHRRDHQKLLSVIASIALLHQHQRQAQTLPSGQPYIEVTLDDIALANELAPEVLGRSLDELPPQTRRLLGCIRELVKKKTKGNLTFSRRELREACGWSLTQVSVHLERLVALEYLAIRHGRLGSAFVYEILSDLDAPEAVAHVGLIDVTALAHAYKTNLTAFEAGVPGQNGQVTGGAQAGPSPIAPLPANDLPQTSRGDGNAHQEPARNTAL